MSTYKTSDQINKHFDKPLSKASADNLLNRIDGYSVLIGKDNRTLDVNPYVLEFIVNGTLARPASDRFNDKLDGDNLTVWFNRLFANTADSTVITLSNGSLSSKNQIKANWVRYITVSQEVWVKGSYEVNKARPESSDSAVKYSQTSL